MEKIKLGHSHPSLLPNTIFSLMMFNYQCFWNNKARRKKVKRKVWMTNYIILHFKAETQKKSLWQRKETGTVYFLTTKNRFSSKLPLLWLMSERVQWSLNKKTTGYFGISIHWKSYIYNQKTLQQHFGVKNQQMFISMCISFLLLL